MLNQQAPEKRRYGPQLEVQSIFYTIQGEGPFCGTPAVFIRLAGCNLQCPGCDTDYTSKRHLMSVDDICDIVTHKMPRHGGLVVITGGEPFRQDLINLIIKLTAKLHYYVQIETNGTLYHHTNLQFNTDVNERKGCYVVVSPKAGTVHYDIRTLACAFKYVMKSDSIDVVDGLPIHVLDHTLQSRNSIIRVARPPRDFKGPIYLQPMDEGIPVKNAMNLASCIQSCMKHGYILQLQIHKLINLE